MVYTMEYYSATKKYEIWPFVITWIDLKSIMLSGISQTERQHIISFTGESKRTKQTRTQTTAKRERVLHTENKLVITSGEGSRGIGETGKAD